MLVKYSDELSCPQLNTGYIAFVHLESHQDIIIIFAWPIIALVLLCTQHSVYMEDEKIK